MVFEWNNDSKSHHIQHLDGAPPEVFFQDLYGTPKDKNLPNPLTGSLFLLEYTDNPTPAPKYEVDETGVVLKGELHIKDEAGNSAVLHPGDTFFIHRGSTITFTAPKFAVAFKAGARLSML